MSDTVTLPGNIFWGSLGLAGFIIFCGLVVLALGHVRPSKQENGADAFVNALGLGKLPGFLSFFVALLWLLLFIAFLCGLGWTLVDIIGRLDQQDVDLRWSLLALAAMMAGFGAVISFPFTLLRTQYNRRQTHAQEQDLITDRINKAVEGLGAEKVVDRIGRPATIWTGKRSKTTHLVDTPKEFTVPPRSIAGDGYWDITELPEHNDVFEGIHMEVSTWESERTVIEWQGEPTAVSSTEHLGSVGSWQVFSETIPNMEVRIGAIHALARIARENLNFHVQVMEILCAYVRENSPADSALPLDLPQMPSGDVGDPRTAWAGWRDGTEGDDGERTGGLRQTLDEFRSLLHTRTDIQTALNVLGHRTPEQQAREAGAPNPERDEAFIFAEPFPEPPNYPEDDSSAARAEWSMQMKAYKSHFANRQMAFLRYKGHRLDLRRTNLQGYDLQELDLRGARFEGAQMQGAVLLGAKMQGAILRGAKMQGANLWGVKMDERTDLSKASLRGAALRSMDETTITQLRDHWDDIFADGTVQVSEGARPEDWAVEELVGLGFETRWHAWQETLPDFDSSWRRD